jgi:hypothetical protein
MINQKSFPPLRSKTVGAVVWLLVALLVILAIIPLMIDDGNQEQTWAEILLALPAILLLLWIWFGTYYTIDLYFLRYYSGPFRGKIPVAAIRSIEYQQSSWQGLRIALSLNGLLIRYNRDDEFYVAPRDKTDFICELQKYNPHISIIPSTDQPKEPSTRLT